MLHKTSYTGVEETVSGWIGRIGLIGVRTNKANTTNKKAKKTGEKLCVGTSAVTRNGSFYIKTKI